MYYFIVNSSGGGGNATSTWKHVKRLLKQRKIEYTAFKTHGKGDATRYATQITENAAKKINLIVVGGDGTINEVLNGIKGFGKVRLGVIPTGSGNDFAKGMGIPKNTTAAFDRILAAGEGRKIDIGQLEIPGESGEKSRSCFFAIGAGIGLD
ncbi:MAG: acylglycerol kinase family protein, partial [Lachnospiraceae bacterium]|nr:acylglycerol kinase family protein [Lachnospiraceae bacterium]